MQYRGQFWQTQTVHVSFRDGQWDTRHEDSGLQQKREFLEEVEGTVETSVKVSFSVLAQLSGLVGLKFAVSPGIALGMTVAYDPANSFLQERAPLQGAHVEALGVKLTFGLGVTLECSDAVAWVLTKLCNYIKAIDLYKWDATPVPVLSLPTLQLAQEGCSAQAVPSLAREDEAEDYQWLLDSEALQITGAKQQAEVDLELMGSLATVALGSFGKIYVFWQPFPFVQIMESVELTAWELALCTATTTTSTGTGSSGGEGATPGITSPLPGEVVCGYQELTSCQMQLAMSVDSASKVCETVQGALGCYWTSNCCDNKMYGVIDVPEYLACFPAVRQMSAQLGLSDSAIGVRLPATDRMRCALCPEQRSELKPFASCVWESVFPHGDSGLFHRLGFVPGVPCPSLAKSGDWVAEEGASFGSCGFHDLQFPMGPVMRITFVKRI
ncbi:unnamed protein product [Symbiodinium sp. CCMP2592]|nr:unnamed protein product [Symbiodinium sp. CCMP2592]